MNTLAYFVAKRTLLCLLSLKYSVAIRTVLKIGEYHSDIPQFSLGHIQSRDRLAQSRVTQDV